MFRNVKLTKKKVQFIKNRTLLSLIFSLVLIVLFFFISFFIQSAKNKSETEAAMAARVNVLEKKDTEQSPVPIVEITEAPTEDHEDGEVAEEETDQSIIYLTFDDGPGEHTERLLGILKKHNVKATFFVTNIFNGYVDMIKREYDDGHAVGIHTLSHDYNKIYASSEAFWKDYADMQAIIKQQTGHETHLMRFPGGSSNTISDFNPGIMTQLVREATQKGFVYFDWNVSSGDAGETTDRDKIVENCKEGVKNRSVSVILCHDIKDYTVNAMDEFITWALENDYVFAKMTENSYTAHHNVNN